MRRISCRAYNTNIPGSTVSTSLIVLHIYIVIIVIIIITSIIIGSRKVLIIDIFYQSDFSKVEDHWDVHVMYKPRLTLSLGRTLNPNEIKVRMSCCVKYGVFSDWCSLKCSKYQNVYPELD